jgi:replicative DNA helicase
MDLELLQLLRNKDNYLRFKQYIKQDVLAKETATIVNWIDTWWSDPKNSSLEWDTFGSVQCIKHAKQFRTEQIEVFRRIFERLQEGHGNGPTQEDILKYFIAQDYAARLGQLVINVQDGKKGTDLLDALPILDRYQTESGRALSKRDVFVETDLAEVAKAVSSGGLEWRLGELNISLGPLRQGDFILVAARVETGKTTFVASESSYMAPQLPPGRPVLWINNEERGQKVMFRVMQAALGVTTGDLFSDLPKARLEFERAVGGADRILIPRESAGLNSVRNLDAFFKEINPGLIIFDQLDKVYGFENEEREDIRLGKLYKWAREKAHEYGPVIAVSQADATAANTEWIFLNQLRGSKTDKPGEADAIITIGKKDNDPTKLYERYIHVPKNKLFGGGPMFDEKERHGFWTVSIEPQYARYRGTR